MRALRVTEDYSGHVLGCRDRTETTSNGESGNGNQDHSHFSITFYLQGQDVARFAIFGGTDVSMVSVQIKATVSVASICLVLSRNFHELLQVAAFHIPAVRAKRDVR
jgi:hypothetical protein